MGTESRWKCDESIWIILMLLSKELSKVLLTKYNSVSIGLGLRKKYSTQRCNEARRTKFSHIVFWYFSVLTADVLLFFCVTQESKQK